jgi:hypothetical protein
VRKLLLSTALAAAYCTIPVHANANKIDTVQDLLQVCTSDNDVEFGKCFGYMAGVVDFNVVCFPRHMTYGQLATVFVTWAQRNPQKWNEDSSHSIQAFTEAWPCK